MRVAKNEGYLDARLTKHELIIDRDERRANVAHAARDRASATATARSTRRRTSSRTRRCAGLLRMQPGDPYTLDSLLRTQYVLDDTLYFSPVDIESGEIDRESRIVPMTVAATPNRKHRFGASVGYGTDTEARGKFTWDNRRVNRRGPSLQARVARLDADAGDRRPLRHSGHGHRAREARVHRRDQRRRTRRHAERAL